MTELECNTTLEYDVFVSNISTNGCVEERTTGSVPDVPLYLLVMTTGFYIFTFVAGVLGNALVVAVVSRNKELKNPTNYFLTNLSIADLLVLLVCMPPALMEIYTKEAWYLGEVACEYFFISNSERYFFVSNSERAYRIVQRGPKVTSIVARGRSQTRDITFGLVCEAHVGF
jgi:hypothetical protein